MAQYNISSGQSPEDFTVVQEALADKVAKKISGPSPLETVIPELALGKYENPTEPTSYMCEPSICVAVQGSKKVILEEDVYIYDANKFLITSIDLPVVAQVLEATPEKPYLSILMKLDLKLASQMIVDTSLPIPKVEDDSRGVGVSTVSVRLLNVLHRLIDLLETPEDIPVMASLIQREITYLLLVGEQGNKLRQMAMAGTNGSQIAKSTKWLKENFSKHIRIDELANLAGMSTSTFHQHFRSLTAMTPLQYQKWIRLHESRRLMLTEKLDVTTAAFQVGYESPSQFSREYRRLFGAPPLRDIKSLNLATVDQTAS